VRLGAASHATAASGDGRGLEGIGMAERRPVLNKQI